ncbi:MULTISPECIES: TVP38/TMEM64 family protein [Halomonadaceae]|uniref:TVP38/TMEM64 family protein n=1 Tax=Halomonadaceae TaxID=28256 RepID=UPI001582287F|nr:MULTISPECIES: TVP38/TMEM64 family protein [Halomonas]MDI4638166.1 TVP38/TMEM64 family protein [Halomonas sp. BMC7]NUJ59166.1 TVP38/TMEM64 family protein [Halomonas taeanensis]
MPRSLLMILLLLVTLLALGGLWQWLAMHDVLTVARLQAIAAGSVAWTQTPWAILVVVAVYAGASLVMFPLSLLVAVTGLLFGPWWGFAYALAGTLAASMLTYGVGRRLGREALMRYGGRHLKGLSRYLAGRGIRTMTVVNLLPLAPFTLTNMLAGAFHLRFRDYLIGSIIGIVPGLVGVTLLGSQLGQLVTANNQSEIAMSLGGIALGVLVLVGLKRYASRRQQREPARSAQTRRPPEQADTQDATRRPQEQGDSANS